MLKRFATLLTLLTALFIFNACDDAPQITEPIINEILTEPIPTTQSRYTGKLRRVGTVKQFGVRAESPDALEWNGDSLYMLADHGSWRNSGQYLFKVDKETGEAVKVNPGAKDLGGSFSQGRGFTQVLYVSPSDMTWDPIGQQMFAVCPVIDSIVAIDLETGLAGRISWKKDYCLRYPEGDTDFDKEFGGYPVIGGGIALAWTHQGIYMWGMSRRSTALNERGFPSFGAFYEISDNWTCAIPVGDPVEFGQGKIGESHAYSLCEANGQLYMSGADTRALYIVDPNTGDLTLVADWAFSEIPQGYAIHESGGIHDLENDVLGGIWITGLTFDGQDMFAVCGFTDALYIVE